MTTVSEELLDASLAEIDPAVAEAIGGELDRQRGTLEMIASENFVPRAVLEAAGSVLTNKYAEGYPGRRYYGGCEQVDIVEQLAIDRAMDLFGAGHANVQPHSGAQANNAAYMALINPGDNHVIAVGSQIDRSDGLSLQITRTDGLLHDHVADSSVDWAEAVGSSPGVSRW